MGLTREEMNAKIAGMDFEEQRAANYLPIMGEITLVAVMFTLQRLFTADEISAVFASVEDRLEDQSISDPMGIVEHMRNCVLDMKKLMADVKLNLNMFRNLDMGSMP